MSIKLVTNQNPSLKVSQLDQPGGPASKTSVDALASSARLVPTDIVSSTYAAASGDLVRVNLGLGDVSVLLPPATGGQRLGLAIAGSSIGTKAKLIAAGSDVFFRDGGPTFLAVTGANSVVVVVSSSGRWFVESSAGTVVDSTGVALNPFVQSAAVGAAGGLATLGTDGRISPSQRWAIGQGDLSFQTVPLADYQALVTRVQALESGGAATSLAVTPVTSAPTALPADSVAFATIDGVSRLFYSVGTHVTIANDVPSTLAAGTICFVTDGNSSRLYYSPGGAVTEVTTIPSTLATNTLAFYKPTGADRATRIFGGTS